jgi:predicted GNAT family acetyltransferase
MIDSLGVIHTPARLRFEYSSGGHTAALTYALSGGRMILLHTGVPAEMEGGGIGGKLVTAAVEYAASKGLTVVPACPFASSWLDRHPDVAALVPIDTAG